MAEILTTKESVAALENIIRNAEKELFLISYSFIVSDHFIKKIKQATERNVKVSVVYGQSIDPKASEQLTKLSNVRISYLPNLHAKVFANEFKCVLGSMNFSEASEKNNNIELGVLLRKDVDASEFSEAVKHCKDIVKESKLMYESSTLNVTVKKKEGDSTRGPSSVTRNQLKSIGVDYRLDRSAFVLSRLREHYGPVVVESEGYYSLRAYGVEVYLNDERIDFIFENNPKYEASKARIAKALKSNIKDRFWVNSKRVNITAKSNTELEAAIVLVMGITLSHLI